MRVRTSVIALGLVLAAAPALTDPQHHHPAVILEPGQDPIRYGHREGVVIPDGAIVPDVPRRGGTTFAPEVDEIVARVDLATYSGFMQGLSGWVPVTVGGNSVTFQTRHSTTPAGQTCWQYAYETFEALGYDVRYQNYSRSGNQLKNIIATIPGETTPERIYVMGAHIDAISQSPATSAKGAEDNGSGSAAVLAAAVALVGERFDSTIELILFSGEEQGLWGSDAYVDDALANDRDVRSAVTFDMIAAWNNDYGVLIEGENAWQPLMFLMADAVDAYTSIERQFSYFSFGSDHVPFQDAGIPAILAIDLDWASYPHYHSTTDTYNRTTPALGLEIARAGIAAVAHQAGPLGQVVDAPVTGRPSLQGAYPNPASRRVTVSFSADAAPHGGAVERARVYDVRGREVRSLAPDAIVAADGGDLLRPVHWDLRDDGGRSVRPGVYWVRWGGDARKVVVAP